MRENTSQLDCFEKIAAKHSSTEAVLEARQKSLDELSKDDPAMQKEAKGKKKRGRKKKKQVDIDNVIQLPFWPDECRAAPNAVVRSALFGISRGVRRKYVKKMSIPAWEGTTITYTGERLNQYDLEVWMQCTHLHRMQKQPHTALTSQRGFFKAMGRTYGDKAANLLQESLDRLVACAVIVDSPVERYSGNLVHQWRIHKENKGWAITLNKKLAELFSGDLTWVQWQERLSLKGNLTRWLHSYVSSHRATPDYPHRIAVSKLRELSGSESALKRFRFDIKKAATQLQDKGVLCLWDISANDAFEFVRPGKSLRNLGPPAQVIKLREKRVLP